MQCCEDRAIETGDEAGDRIFVAVLGLESGGVDWVKEVRVAIGSSLKG